MAQPDSTYSDLRGDFGDLLLGSDIFQDVNFVDYGDNLIIKDIAKAREILLKQKEYIDDSESELLFISIKGQVIRSLENALRLMSVYKGASVSAAAYSCPPTQKEMKNFLDRWRKNRSNS